MNLTIHKDGFSISTDKAKLDVDAIHDYLSTQSYWAKNIPKERVRMSIQNSYCFGVYEGQRQIGLARLVTDFSTMAYLCDVYILESHRGQGLSKWLIDTIMQAAHLQGLRRWILLTADAHGLYRQFGWQDVTDPTRWMEIHDKAAYAKE